VYVQEVIYRAVLYPIPLKAFVLNLETSKSHLSMLGCSLKWHNYTELNTVY